jgi:hypothetical protein
VPIGGIEQHARPDDVGVEERCRPGDRGNKPIDESFVADVAVFEGVPRVIVEFVDRGSDPGSPGISSP